MCRPSIRSRCIIFQATEPSRRTSDFFRAREFCHECGALNLPRREATQNLCKKLTSLSVPKITEKFNAGKEQRCLPAECGPDSLGHTRALEVPFCDPGSKAAAELCPGLRIAAIIGQEVNTDGV